MSEKRFRENKLGLIGWLSGGRYGLERYAYTLHRVTGIGLLLYFMIHIVVTSSRAFSEQAWETWMGTFNTPLFKIGEYLVFVAFAFHGLNGIRLFFAEIGIGLGRPIRPIYPYRVSIHRQRPVFILVMLMAAIVIVIGGYDFFLVK